MISVDYAILQTLLKLLKEIDFQPQPGDDVRRIEPASIVFRKVSPTKDRDPAPLSGIDLPALVVTTPFAIPSPNAEGENEVDVYHYRFLIQICSPEIVNTDANIGTYWLWRQRIARAFNNQVNVDWGLCSDGSCVQQVLVDVVNEVDPKQYVQFQNAICGVQLRFQTWQPRGFDT